MSAFVWPGRPRIPQPIPSVDAGGPRPGWIGVDLSTDRPSRRSHALVPLLVVGIVAALGVAALRIDLIRTRYAIAATLDQEQALMEEQRALTLRKRELRDPVALAIRARELGFKAPAHVFSLPEPDTIRHEVGTRGRSEGSVSSRARPIATGATP